MRLSEEDRRKPLSASYHNRVTQLDWERALDTVEEAWQLEIVIYEHCDHEFSNSPQYQDARYVRVRNMFKRYARPQPRMDELNAMISSFVAPRDRLWDYVGD